MNLTKKILIGLTAVILITVVWYYYNRYVEYNRIELGSVFIMPFTVKVEAIDSPYSITENSEFDLLGARKAYSDYKPTVKIELYDKLGYIDQNSLNTVIYDPDIVYTKSDNNSIKIENIPFKLYTHTYAKDLAEKALIYVDKKGKTEKNIKINYFIPNDPSINKKISMRDEGNYKEKFTLEGYPDPVILNFENGILNIRDEKTGRLVNAIEGEVVTVDYKITIDIPTDPWQGHFEKIRL